MNDLCAKIQTLKFQVFRYAINEINQKEDLLPNITLGFIIMDDCFRDLTALARSLTFIPDIPKQAEYSLMEINENFTTNVWPSNHKENNGIKEICGPFIEPVPVAGLVGPRTSKMSIFVASILSLFQVRISDLIFNPEGLSFQ